MDDLPSDFDVIIVGTGMTESIVAGAFSRIGKSVLHLDSNDHYGEDWASFSLEGLIEWCKKSEKPVETPEEDFNSLINESEEVIRIKPNTNVYNCSINKFVSKIKEDSEELQSVEEKLLKLSRKFNLDLCPKLLFSRGVLVQLLITSNIARYAEFKSVNRVLTWREGQLEPVPCSRADVFATKNVTVVHKRILVKILTLFATYTENLDEFKGFENKTFFEYLKHKKLPDNLIHYILYSIAMGDNTTPCLEGVKGCKAFLESLGRYGNTPFIFPVFGSGELPQCFCRLCAVYGGIYCLQRGIEGLIMKNGECVGVISHKKRINAKVVVLSTKYVPQNFFADEEPEKFSRGIFITDRSILKSDKESLTLLQFPPISKVADKPVTILELGSGTCTCPENYFVVHMTSKMGENVTKDLDHVVQALFNTSTESEDCMKPKILWSGIWNVAGKTWKKSQLCPKNVKICCGVDSELDYNLSVSEAKRIFKELYPNEEFLPRAPDADEIVLDGEENTTDNKENKNTSEENSDNVKEKSDNPEEKLENAEEKSDNGKEKLHKAEEKLDNVEKKSENSEQKSDNPEEKSNSQNAKDITEETLSKS